jgi:hypothetical protein
LKCPGSREKWNNLQQIFADLNIEYQISLRIIIIDNQNASRPNTLHREQIIRDITKLLKMEELIEKNWVKWMFTPINSKFLRVQKVEKSYISTKNETSIP